MVRIDEVAKAAGVSISTVSYALSGKRPVSASTKQRVEDAVQTLGYHPNAGGRMLAARRTQIIAVTEPLHEHTHAPTHMAFVLAASMAARRVDCDILLLTQDEASAGMRRVAESGLVDAVLVLDVAPDDERATLARSLSTPTVFIGVPDDTEGLTCVDLDFERAAGLSVDTLADAGHTSIGLVGQPAETYSRSNFPPRVRDGFLARTADRGVTGHFRALEGATPAAQARTAVNALLAEGVTALVLHCGADVHELVLAHLATLGLRTPSDISVVSVASSFDTAQFDVPLTSVPLVPQESCDLAVSLAARWIDGDPAPAAVHLIAPTLVERGSVAAPSPRSV